MSEYPVIDSDAALRRAVAALASGTGPFAVDVERAAGYRYSARAYLVQIFRRDAGVFLLDAPALTDFAVLRSALASEEWVLHAASQDLPSLRELGLEPERIFDTELAARLLGHDRVGLGAVVASTLGVELAKEYSAANWSTRPLPPQWLEYAALDVLYLVDVRDALERELHEQGKAEAAAQEFRAVLERPPKPARAEPWRRLSGIHSLRGRRALAQAREFWQAREALAEQLDVAPGRLIPDRAIVAAIAAGPTTKAALSQVPGFTGRASRTELDRWWLALERGRTAEDLPEERSSSDTLPPPRAWAARNPPADLRLKAARARIGELARVVHMPTENLLSPDALRRLAWSPPDPPDPGAVAAALTAAGPRPWQVAATAPVIADAFVEALKTEGADGTDPS